MDWSACPHIGFLKTKRRGQVERRGCLKAYGRVQSVSHRVHQPMVTDLCEPPAKMRGECIHIDCIVRMAPAAPPLMSASIDGPPVPDWLS